MRNLFVVSVAALAITASALGAQTKDTARALPSQGILTPGVSLGGVHIGDTMNQVTKVWGHDFRQAPRSQCKGTDTCWFYVYAQGEPLGAAVRFDRTGHAIAVFTLGSPAGWRTADGLLIGQGVEDATKLYGNLTWSVCIGYGAMSMRTTKAVTSIYTSGEAIYGFAITAPGTPICQ